MPDGAFDIHYVDASGNEIPPDKALAAQVKVHPGGRTDNDALGPHGLQAPGRCHTLQ